MPQDISRHKSYTKVVISLGSNVARDNLPSEAVIGEAFSEIQAESVRLGAASRLYRTPCVPAGAGPDYVNAAAVLYTALNASEFMAHLHAVESAFDRRRESRWAARTLDLDLLDFGGTIAPDQATWQRWHDLPFEQQKTLFPDRLILPHPRIQDRAFVLVPLAEIAPDWCHPVLGRTAAELREALAADQLAGIRPI